MESKRAQTCERPYMVKGELRNLFSQAVVETEDEGMFNVNMHIGYYFYIGE